MAVHVIVGYGAIGRGAAALLAGQGHEVRVVTRSGGPRGEPGGGGPGRIAHLALDAADAAALTAAADAAAVIYNCASPAYHRWVRDWPPLSAALLAAAERTGAVLATVSNLYGYGPVTGPMTEQLPLAATGRKGMVRARMWQEALAAHRAGRARVTEVRASDYIGPGAQSLLGDRVLPRLLAGRAVQVTGGADTPHTWSYVGDVARLLVTVGGDQRAWGRPWHVPSGAPRSQREAIGDLARVAGVGPVRVTEVPRALLALGGLVSPVLRELPEVAYQTEAPFIMDSTAAQAAFGLAPQPWDEVLAQTVAAYAGRSRPRSRTTGMNSSR
jgi:nucleoside-diphosphate-sugar epimerase